ncbi:MAG: hypothetical protein GY869_03230, partial [Planctomycetes bacterium]|nr:hypothetical protein [Planctomycetota bacterium]
MPLVINPKKTYKITLSSDDADPKPVLVYQYLSFDESLAVGMMQNEMQATEAVQFPKFLQDNADRLFELLTCKLVSWENVDDDFSTGKLRERLSIYDAMELLNEIGRQQTPTVE